MTLRRRIIRFFSQSRDDSEVSTQSAAPLMIFYSIDVRHSRQSDYSVRVIFPEGGKIALLPQETIIARIRHRELLLPCIFLQGLRLCPRSRVKRSHPDYVIASFICEAISPQFRNRELLLRSDLIPIPSSRAALVKRSHPDYVIASLSCEAISSI